MNSSSSLLSPSSSSFILRLLFISSILLVLVLLLVGCGSGGGDTLASYNFKQGSNGLNMKLVDNAPPSKIYPQSSFKMILELDNQAAYDVSDGMVKIVGLDNNYFKVAPLEQSFDTLAGRSLTSPSGDKVYLEFDGLSAGLFENAQEYSGVYFIKTSFHSTLDFVETVCINPNLYAVYDAGCKVKEKETYSGQGASLAVSQMEEIMYPGAGAGAEFRITLRNKRNMDSQVGFVNLMSATLGGEDIPCEFQGEVSNKRSKQFKDQQEVILVCKKPLRQQSSYQTSLALHFTYDYSQKLESRLLLVNPERRAGVFG